MFRSVLALLPVLALASARMAYQLPAGAEFLLKGRSISDTFSCEGRSYGYYADVDNDCQLFHVCLPVTDADGALIEMAHFTFVCGNETRFSQETLTCAGEGDAFPCEDSSSLYDIVNANFGLIPDDVPRVRSEPVRSEPVRPEAVRPEPESPPEETPEEVPETPEEGEEEEEEETLTPADE